MDVKIKLLSTDAILPSYAHEGDAGLDVYSTIDYELESGRSVLVPLGFTLELPENTEAQIRPRSGLALKSQVTVLNSPGTIDCGYRGEVGVILINHGLQRFFVTKGMKVAQMVIKPILSVKLVVVDSLEGSARGANGFGSTGN